MPNRAVIFGPIDAKYGLPEWIELDEEWVCKNRQGNDPRRLEARINPDHDNPESCMVRTIMELQRRKQDKQKLPDKRFWWNIYEPARNDPETHEKWYKNCVMGRHTMAKLLINALEKSGVDCKAEKYTATSARKTMMDGGLDAGIPEVLLERKAGQRTDKAKNSYIQNKDVTHRATNITLSRVGRGLNPKYQEILNKLVQEDSDALAGAVANKGGLSKEKDVQQDPQYLFGNDDADEEGFGTTISQSRMEESKERAEQGVSHHAGGGSTSAGGGSKSAGEGSTSAGHNQAVRSSNQFNLNLMGPGTTSYQGAAFHPGFGQNTLAYNQSTMPPFELFRQHGNQFQLLSQQHQMPQMLMNQMLQQQQMILLQQPNPNLIQMLQQQQMLMLQENMLPQQQQLPAQQAQLLPQQQLFMNPPKVPSNYAPNYPPMQGPGQQYMTLPHHHPQVGMFEPQQYEGGGSTMPSLSSTSIRSTLSGTSGSPGSSPPPGQEPHGLSRKTSSSSANQEKQGEGAMDGLMRQTSHGSGSRQSGQVYGQYGVPRPPSQQQPIEPDHQFGQQNLMSGKEYSTTVSKQTKTPITEQKKLKPSLLEQQFKLPPTLEQQKQAMVPMLKQQKKVSGKENLPESRSKASIGDVKLHKMKGFPYWPVKITSIEAGR